MVYKSKDGHMFHFRFSGIHPVPGGEFLELGNIFWTFKCHMMWESSYLQFDHENLECIH